MRSFMRKRTVGGVFLAVLAGAVVGGTGCSSSSGGGTPTEDAGNPHHDAAIGHDTGTTHHDAHVVVTKDSAADTKSNPPPGDSGGGDAAAECSPGSVASYSPTTYVPAVVAPGVCSASAISAFVAACGFSMSASDSACLAWLAANVTDGGASCGNCIVGPKNNGAVWLAPGIGDAFTNSYPNYAACMQVLDPTNGATCGAAFNNVDSCLDIACNTEACFNATDPMAQNNCESTAAAAGCMTPVTAANTACATDVADGGAENTCTPSANSGDEDDDFNFIIKLLCGGPDAG